VNTYREKIRIPRTEKSIASLGGRLSAADLVVRLPTRQTRSSTVGSYTQIQSIGSSTQNQLIESSTQKETIEKSTNDTAKQTKADYGIPIQTLLAFLEQGLVSLPTKTWASIVDEEEEPDQESLEQIIQDLKNKTLQVNPRPINQIIPKQQETSIRQFQNYPSQNTNQNPQVSYIPKNKLWPVIQMEPEY
jgi:hypothetical protein